MPRSTWLPVTQVQRPRLRCATTRACFLRVAGAPPESPARALPPSSGMMGGHGAGSGSVQAPHVAAEKCAQQTQSFGVTAFAIPDAPRNIGVRWHDHDRPASTHSPLRLTDGRHGSTSITPSTDDGDSARGPPHTHRSLRHRHVRSGPNAHNHSCSCPNPTVVAGNDSTPSTPPFASSAARDMRVEVGIDSTHDRARRIYDGHRHPFLSSTVEGWHARPGKETVSRRLFAQPARSPSGTGHAQFQHRPIDRRSHQTSTSTGQIKRCSPSTAKPRTTTNPVSLAVMGARTSLVLSRRVLPWERSPSGSREDRPHPDRSVVPQATALKVSSAVRSPRTHVGSPFASNELSGSSSRNAELKSEGV